MAAAPDATGTGPDEDPTAGPDGPLDERALGRARAEVWTLNAVLFAVVAAGLWIVPEAGTPLLDRGAWMLLAVGVAFFAAEPLVFHIEARNEAVSFSPTELPLALGMLFLSPVHLVLVRVVSGGLGLATFRRQEPFKTVFNLASYATETMIAVLVFRWLAPDDLTLSPLVWGSLSLALLLALFVGGLVVALAISRFERDLADRVRREFGHGYVFYVPEAFIAATTIVPSVAAAWFPAISVLPVLAVWSVLRSHGTLMHRFSDLSEVHDFSHRVASSTHPDEIAETAVAEIASNLRAARVAITVWDDAPNAPLATAGDPGLVAILSGIDDRSEWARALGAERALVVRPDEETSHVAQRLGDAGVDEAILVLLTDDDGPLGILCVADRHGAATRFAPDEVGRTVTIASQLSVALRKGRLYVRVQHEATHDRLTGLANRALFEAHTDAAMASRHHATVMLIDLDRFKQVNDTLGHAAGDRLLVEVARRLELLLHDGCLFSRLGGDEFALLVTGSSAVPADELARAIADELERPFSVDGSQLSVGASIGLATAPLDGHDTATLLRRADLAMYAAKRTRRGIVHFHADLEDPEDAERLTMLGDLRAAVRLRSIAVHYQPKVRLATGQVVGVEALARWDRPNHGPVPPDRFIALAEQSGLIDELTDHVLDTVLHDVAALRALGHDIGAAVNVSAHSLSDVGLAERVAERVAAHAVPTSALTMEITETAMMLDADNAANAVGSIGASGVGVSIDDFGTGWSSLVSLRRLPITELKIDRSFVADMLSDESDLAIVRSTIDLGRALGLTVVAEGVESDDLFDVLCELGCHVAQGYGIARPMRMSDLIDWLAEHDPVGSSAPTSPG